MGEEGPQPGPSGSDSPAPKSGNGNQAKTMTSSRNISSGNKHKKIVRVLTVIAYVCSVSTAAVLLSAYYIFLWNPNPPDSADGSQSTMAMARQMENHPSLTTTNYNPAYLPASRVQANGLAAVGGGGNVGSIRSFHGPVKKVSKLVRERYYHVNHNGMPLAQPLVGSRPAASFGLTPVFVPASATSSSPPKNRSKTNSETNNSPRPTRG